MDRRDLEDYGIDPDGPDDPPTGEEIDPALSALLNGLPGVSAEDLEEMLKDLPLPETGATGGISVEEAVEVKNICYIMCYIACYLTPYFHAAQPFATAGQGSTWTFYCK